MSQFASAALERPRPRTDPMLALSGRRCVPAWLEESGFTFAFPELRPALVDLLGR